MMVSEHKPGRYLDQYLALLRIIHIISKACVVVCVLPRKVADPLCPVRLFTLLSDSYV